VDAARVAVGGDDARLQIDRVRVFRGEDQNVDRTTQQFA
jgi:hypothetical protein